MFTGWLIGLFAVLPEPSPFLDGSTGMPSVAWVNVTEQTACEAMRDDYCLGHFGFTIKEDATFIAGPSPQGNKVEGRMKPQELRRLEALIGTFSPSSSNRNWRCDPGALPGIKSRVVITFTDGSVARVYDLGATVGKICYIGVWDDVRRLHEYLHKLMIRYYPVPFPTD